MPDSLAVVFVVFVIDLFSSSSILKFAASKEEEKKPAYNQYPSPSSSFVIADKPLSYVYATHRRDAEQRCEFISHVCFRLSYICRAGDEMVISRLHLGIK